MWLKKIFFTVLVLDTVSIGVRTNVCIFKIKILFALGPIDLLLLIYLFIIIIIIVFVLLLFFFIFLYF